MITQLTAVVLQEDPVIQKTIEDFASQSNFINLGGSFHHPEDALKHIRSNAAQVLIADQRIFSPEHLKAFKSVPSRPDLIVTTNTEKTSVRLLDIEVMDFLSLPIQYNRFLRTFSNFRKDLIHLYSDCGDGCLRLYLRFSGEYTGVPVSEIAMVNSRGDYVVIATQNRRFTVHSTLTGILKLLPENQFIRVHRSYIVNKTQVTVVEENFVRLGSVIIPIGGTYKEEVLRTLQN